ncbi:MAG: cupin [Planctomycetia bacterium]|jgi:quercetin dioxygenase-like cupin family protein
MNKPLVKPGEFVDIQLLGGEPGIRKKTILVKTANVEIIHLVIPESESIPTHEAQGEIILHCLEGRVSVSALEKTVELSSGQLFYFSVNEPFSIQGIEHASLIATIVAPQQGPAVELIGD